MHIDSKQENNISAVSKGFNSLIDKTSVRPNFSPGPKLILNLNKIPSEPIQPRPIQTQS